MTETKKKILVVVGTRPNFIKITQFKKAASSYPRLDLRIVHTGQHFDSKMADVFFEQFQLAPDFFLNIAPASPNTQMAEIMKGLEKLFHTFRPELLVVVGDVNSTLAAALAANKCGIMLAHVESGLRSFDRSMPEEFNRVLTDELTDHFFVTEQSGIDHLKKEGKAGDSISFVGNTMIDTMVAFSKQIETSSVLTKLDLKKKKFVLMTMHRPATVDLREGIEKLGAIVSDIAASFKIVFPVHPRTLKNIDHFGMANIFRDNPQIILCEPLDYFSFQKLISDSAFILTDSGGIQEESTFLRVPCLTLRPNTERPVTVTLGTNELVPFNRQEISEKIAEIMNGSYKKGLIPPLWDGKATERIMEKINQLL